MYKKINTQDDYNASSNQVTITNSKEQWNPKKNQNTYILNCAASQKET